MFGQLAVLLVRQSLHIGDMIEDLCLTIAEGVSGQRANQVNPHVITFRLPLVQRGRLDVYTESASGLPGNGPVQRQDSIISCDA